MENIYDNVRLIVERLENEFPDFNVSGFEDFLKTGNLSAWRIVFGISMN